MVDTFLMTAASVSSVNHSGVGCPKSMPATRVIARWSLTHGIAESAQEKHWCAGVVPVDLTGWPAFTALQERGFYKLDDPRNVLSNCIDKWATWCWRCWAQRYGAQTEGSEDSRCRPVLRQVPKRRTPASKPTGNSIAGPKDLGSCPKPSNSGVAA
jgi:hypothetical protein